MTLASLDAWAKAPGQSQWEQKQRQSLVHKLTTTRAWGFMRSVRLPKNLNFNGCTSLTSLPDGLRVGGGIYLGGCTSLTSLPDGLRVGGYLNLIGCTSLTSLPKEIRVGGNLNLRGCTSLTSLPKGLRVGGNLDLSDCTSLTSLPDGLRVGGYLNLIDCASLTSLPDGLSVGGDLFLSGCTSLTSLPEAILRWPRCQYGLPHIIDITNTGIPPGVIENIRRLAGAGVQVTFGASRDTDALQAFADLAAARAFWQPLAAAAKDDVEHAGGATDALAAEPRELRNLLVFLSRLSRTADYQNVRSRPLLAARVMRLLAALGKSPKLAAVCHERIGQALESCGDRVIWAMNQLELALCVHDAEAASAPQQALRTLGRALVRLHEVHRHAAIKTQTLRVVDPIEVYLAYETALAEPLKLPVSTRGMLYPELANVAQKDLNAARKDAERADNADNVASFLASWEPWQKYLRRTRSEGHAWEHLAPAPAEMRLADDASCMLTLETPAEIRADGRHLVVIANGSGHWSVFEFEACMRWWLEHGTHPSQTARRLHLRDIFRWI